MTAAEPEVALVGSSAVMRGVRATIGQLAGLPWPVLIEGPTGTGKTIAARLFHSLSPRAHGPFVTCSLTMLSESLALDQLVGHVRGAFTGAVFDHMGKFEAAHGGTLFLDEVGTAIPAVQLMLLQLLEGREVQRVGEHRARLVDVRLVFATNANLQHEVSAGRFREDLLHRVGGLTVRMPALRDHPQDIIELAVHIFAGFPHEICKPRPMNTRELATLQAYDWPGNVRELQNVLQYFSAFGELPGVLNGAGRDEDWRSHLDETLTRHNGVKSQAARALGVSRKTVHQELKRRAASSA